MSPKPKSIPQTVRRRKPLAETPSLKRAASPETKTPLGDWGIKKILIPTDFSDAAVHGLQYGAAMANQFGAAVVLLHVLEPVTYPAGVESIPLLVPEGEIHETLTRKLEDLGQRHLDPAQKQRVMVRDGQPYREICAAAEQEKADLVVISTHGYTGLKHVFLGSTAERVVRHATCPVLVVR